MKLERVVVEFTHPGVEYIPKKRVFDEHVIWKDEKKTSGIRKWNELPSHKRKFLLCKGTYVDKDWKAKQAPLTFWGEWEAQSYFKSTGLKKGISPQFLHKPFLDDSYSGLRKNNTDPFVFGNNFWYTNCKQRKGSFTTRLDDFSIILFGTERKNGFYLDTVFVVGKSISPPFSDRFLETCSIQLLKTNFLFKNMAINEDRFYLKYYRGLSFQESSDCFSFSPCKIYSHSNFHDRPILRPYYKFHLQKPGTRTVCVRLMKDKMHNGSLPLDVIKQYWNLIVQECFSQGFALGVSFDLPKLV